jgi:hypothetical protein
VGMDGSAASGGGGSGGGGGGGGGSRISTDELASAVLGNILAPDLLEALGASGAPSRPTDSAVIAELPREKIEPYAQLVVRPCDGDSEEPVLELRGTGSSFGNPLSDVRGELALAEPLDGASELRGEYKGRLVLMWRGGCSFIEKVRRAQTAGALACVVVQTAAVWPFTMSDSKLQGGDIEIPSLMLKSEDGEALREAVQRGAPLTAHALAKCSTCAICQEEMIATTEALKLPCGHTFHEDCLTKWLGKQHTCPTCRAKLPEKHAAPAPAPAAAAAPLFPDFGGPRGRAGPASESMYT